MRQASSRSKPPADERVPLLGVDFRGQRGLRRWRSGVFDLRQSYMSIIEGLLLGALFGEATDRNRLSAVIRRSVANVGTRSNRPFGLPRAR